MAFLYAKALVLADNPERVQNQQNPQDTQTSGNPVNPVSPPNPQNPQQADQSNDYDFECVDEDVRYIYKHKKNYCADRINAHGAKECKSDDFFGCLQCCKTCALALAGNQANESKILQLQ